MRIVIKQTPDELWKIAPSYKDYEVSSLGRVRRATPAMGTWVGRLLKLSYYGKYVVVGLPSGVQRKFTTVGVHQLVADAFIGPCPKGNQVNHKDLDKTNNKPGNLEYMTPSANCQHAIENGHWTKGSKNGMAKLRERDVAVMRFLYRTGKFSQSELGRRYGVAANVAWYVLRGRTWKDLECES